MNQTEAVGQQTTHNLLHAIHHVPVRHDLRLLISSIPHRTEDQKRWLADCFEDTEQCSDSDQCREALTYSMESEEVQKHWSDQVATEHTLAMAEYNKAAAGNPSNDPTDQAE